MSTDAINEKSPLPTPSNITTIDDKATIVLEFLDEKRRLIEDDPPELATPKREASPAPSEPEEVPEWVAQRDMAVRKAVANHDDVDLARLSAQPGGFGSRVSRKRAWFELLHVDHLTHLQNASRDTTPETDTEGVAVNAPHCDENQVALDTRRSFVTYPRGLSKPDKSAMQEDLQNLIVTVLQRHPRLGYFQGFHDIMTVLYLTLLNQVPRSRDRPSPEERIEWAELVRAAEVVALCRTRDAMGKGLAPMMGMLKLLRRLLAAADPQLYRVSASISPVPTLPFFALSWILTLFSHDVDTLEPVQRIFDYLIARNPISCIYLAVAILMAKKPQMARLVAELGPEATQDPSLLHPLFARLPPLYPDTPDAPTPPAGYKLPEQAPHEEPNPYSPIPLSQVFALADKLMVQFPPDSKRIRAHEVFGPGSAVRTYEKEKPAPATDRSKGNGSDKNNGSGNHQAQKEWTLADAEDAIDKDVILPGGDEADEEDALVAPPRLPRISSFVSLVGLRCEGFGPALALGVVVVGIGAVLFGWRTQSPQWIRFWGLVASGWSARSREASRSWAMVAGYATRTLREVL